MVEPTQASIKPPTTFKIRAPSKYLAHPSKPSAIAGDPFIPPPLEWLWRTWTVTHSTLSMWRSARNVRITYKPYKPESRPVANDNLVEYEKKNGKGGVKRVEGIERPDAVIPGAWTWRGKGLLAIASSHWEILGWGERPLTDDAGDTRERVERWAVTWFAPTLFTQEGVDIYSDRKEGLSKEAVEGIVEALKGLEDAPKLVELVDRHMREVDINLPWKEGVNRHLVTR